MWLVATIENVLCGIRSNGIFLAIIMKIYISTFDLRSRVIVLLGTKTL